MRLVTLLVPLLLVVTVRAENHKAKIAFHISNAVIVEGLGLYNSISTVADDDLSSLTKASAATNLVFVAATVGGGAFLKFSKKNELKPKIRVIHKILGYSLAASSLWLANQIHFEESVPDYRKALGWVGYGAVSVQVISATIMF